MGEIDSNIILVGDFNIPLASIDRSSRQKINNETQVLNDTSKEMDLIDISRAMNPKSSEYTFISSTHGTLRFSRIDYMLGHKVSLGKFNGIKIM